VVVLERFDSDAEVLYSESGNVSKVFRGEVIGVAFKVNITSHIKCPIDVVQYAL